MKRIICWIMCLVLLCLAGTAMASEGDRILVRLGSEEGLSTGTVDNAFLVGRKVYIITYQSVNYMLKVYDLDTQEAVDYNLQNIYDVLLNDVTLADAEEGETAQDQIACWFSREDGLYCVTYRMRASGNGSKLDSACVRKLSLEGDEPALTETDLPALDWSPMMEDYGTWMSSRWSNGSICVGNRLLMSCFDDSGNPVLMVYDLTTGEGEERYVPDMNALGWGTAERPLIIQERWGERSVLTASLYDCETEELEELCRFELSDVYPRGITYDEKNDTLYYVQGGELYAAANCDTAGAQAVNDCPLNGNATGLITEDGLILLHDYSNVLLRNTDPSKRSQISLHVRPYAWSQALDASYYAFNANHADITVVLEEYGTDSALLQAMMNRDDRVDIYLMNMSESAFNAVYDRGFMADLSGSEILTSAAEKMYPAFRESMMKNGKLVFIPVGAYGNDIGYTVKVWEALGLTEADVPRTWDQFFDLIEALPEKTQGTEYRPFESYITKEDFRYSVFRSILSQYSMEEEDRPFNNDLIRGLLERLDRLDYDALSLLSNEELSAAEESGMEDNRRGLISSYTALTLENAYGDGVPFILGFREGTETRIPITISAAWVNPYTQHPQEAIEYLESMITSLPVGTRYSLSPENNEPVRYPDHEEQKKNIQKWLDEAKLNLEKAEDEEDRERWETIVAEYEKELNDFDSSYWMISPASIETYRTWAEKLSPAKWNLMNQLYSGNEAEAFMNLFQGYMEGVKKAEEILSYIDRKVQMMRLEGN